MMWEGLGGPAHDAMGEHLEVLQATIITFQNSEHMHVYKLYDMYSTESKPFNHCYNWFTITYQLTPFILDACVRWLWMARHAGFVTDQYSNGPIPRPNNDPIPLPYKQPERAMIYLCDRTVIYFWDRTTGRLYIINGPLLTVRSQKTWLCYARLACKCVSFLLHHGHASNVETG